MTNDLISRSALMAHFKQDEWGTPDERWRPEREFGRMVLNAPAVDAVKVQHGYWIEASQELQRAEDLENGNKQYFCSNCNAGDLHAVTQDVPYCWKCGAKMDKVL